MKTLHFATARALADWYNQQKADGHENTVVAITADPVSGGLWLFYNPIN